MKKISLITFALIGTLSFAMSYTNNTTNYISAYYTELSNYNDSLAAAYPDSIIEEEYTDVNVEVIENNNTTSIIVHKDGDTIKNYEMNYDFQSKNDKADKIDKKDKSKSFNFEFNSDNDDNFFTKRAKRRRFKGHWSGFEFGLNNYLTDDFSITPDEEYMEINTGKSWNFNLNFAQVSVPLIRDRVGLVSGLGIEWNNYHFSNGNTIKRDPITHTIVPVPLTNMALKKNKLTTTYLTVPLLLEAQIGSSPNRSERFAVSAGLIGGLKIGSHTKYKTSDNKEKNKDDFYLQSLRYGFTARVNYNSFGLYFNYYNVPLFIEDKGSELYPFAAGLVISFN